MAELSPPADATASKRLQGSLQSVATALAHTPLDVLAAAIGKDDSQTSRIRSGQLGAPVSDVVRLLHAAGLKVVAADKVCVDRATYEAFSHIATKAMACPDTARKLTWDE